MLGTEIIGKYDNFFDIISKFDLFLYCMLTRTRTHISKFDINNHIILCPRKYRGRLVTENNVQDCINELVTKYIPAEHPQWQIIVIPVANSASTSISENEPNVQVNFSFNFSFV